MAITNRPAPRDRARPVARFLSVIAQDPSVKDMKGNILMSKTRVPRELVQPGPIGYRVQIVDYDATEGTFHGAHALPVSFEQEPAAWKQGKPKIVADYRFHAQNAYALVMKTLARFEYALGRRVGWSFRTHQLKVAPHGMLDANAFYTRDAEGLVFGYFPGRDGTTVYTCLSHDVVVHETTHALLDALRERYLDPSSPDQAAFHEGFADVIALLSVFAQEELVQELLRRGRTRRRAVPPEMIHASDVSVSALKNSALFGLAEQMGQEMEGVRGNALRNSATLPLDPALRNSGEFLEPHRRGELLVAAVLHAFVTAWARRIAGLAAHGNDTYSLARVAEEGADIAEALVTMWIRALDYMPPVHVEFGDALSGALTADLEVRPNDNRYQLRAHTLNAFKAYGFAPAAETTQGIWDLPPTELDYENVRFESMRTDKDEVFRFLWENRQKLQLRPGAYTQVLSVRPCTRVGEDGFTLRETVAEYYQVARLTPAELLACRIKLPDGWIDELKEHRSASRARRARALGDEETNSSDAQDDGDELVTPLYGGGTLIFDDYGRLKYWIHNDVFGARQSARLEYLYRAGLLRAGRGGARLSAARLSTVHRLRALDARKFPQEGWWTMAKKPTKVELRAYQVGFGDCFLLSFIYGEDDKRHVLIDFGTTELPKGRKASDHMPKVARQIESDCGQRLTALVATHRHADHISGFGTDGKTGKSGEIIRALKPKVVIQPWTEDPRAANNATHATTDSSRSTQGFIAGLAAMHAVADAVLALTKRPPTWMGAELAKDLRFLGMDNIKNRSAVENLIAMGKARGAKAVWVRHGSNARLGNLLPGVKVRVLGPPSLVQSEKIRKQRTRDVDQFWHLLAGPPALRAQVPLAKGLKRRRRSAGGTPPEARWFRDRLQRLRGTQLLEIVRSLDDQMNNTSVILLFEVGGKKLLFPGDAQIENWSYALEDAPDHEATRALLANVDLYKVGHHGSLNATPKKLLWEGFKKRGSRKRLKTVLSTLPGKHGKTRNETEVPRRPLLKALKAESNLKNTNNAKDFEPGEISFRVDVPM